MTQSASHSTCSHICVIFFILLLSVSNVIIYNLINELFARLELIRRLLSRSIRSDLVIRWDHLPCPTTHNPYTWERGCYDCLPFTLDIFARLNQWLSDITLPLISSTWDYRRHISSAIFMALPVSCFHWCTGDLIYFRNHNSGPLASHENGVVRINSATAHMHPSLSEGEPPNSIAGVRLSVVCRLFVCVLFSGNCSAAPRFFVGKPWIFFPPVLTLFFVESLARTSCPKGAAFEALVTWLWLRIRDVNPRITFLERWPVLLRHDLLSHKVFMRICIYAA